jgi:hypothetical protein
MEHVRVQLLAYGNLRLSCAFAGQELCVQINNVLAQGQLGR